MCKLRLTEGPGAGYTIYTGAIHSFVTHSATVTKASLSNYGFIIEVDCDISAEVDTVSADSYYYSTGEITDVPVNIYQFSLDGVPVTRYNEKDLFTPDGYGRIATLVYKDYSSDYDSLEDVELWELSNEELSAYIQPSDFNTTYLVSQLEDNTSQVDSTYSYGGGYTHSKYDGTLVDPEKWFGNDIYYTIGVDIADTAISDFIDCAVTGDNVEITYEVYDENNGFLEEFDDEDEAISFARAHDADHINKVTDYISCYGDSLMGPEISEISF